MLANSVCVCVCVGGGGGLLREAGLPVAEFGVLTRGGKLAGGRIWGAN